MREARDGPGHAVLDGQFERVTRAEMARIFAGNIEIPMLDEKTEVWQQAGAALVEKYGGYFHNFARSCPPKLYDSGRGIIERLAKEFRRFNDVSRFDGHEVIFFKLPQLGIWLFIRPGIRSESSSSTISLR